MIRIARLVVPAAAALLLAACGGDTQQSSATPADSADMVKATSAIPGALGGTPARAQEGVDNSNAATQQRASQVDSLANEASGPGTPTP